MRDDVPLRRWLLNLAAAASLVVLMAGVALWAKSFWMTDHLMWRDVAADERLVKEHSLLSIRGRLILASQTLNIDAAFYTGEADMQRLKDEAGLWHWWSAQHVGQLMRAPRVLFTVPHWLVIPLFAVLPLIWWRQWWRDRRRRLTGLCPNCGYDLRTTPGRCPECGESPEAAPPTAA